MMMKAANNLRIAFNSPALPTLADHDEWSDSEVDENMAMTPLQIKRDANGLMKLVRTPKPVGKVDAATSVDAKHVVSKEAPNADEDEDEEEGRTMTLMQARQFRGLRMALHASKMQNMRSEAKIAALTSEKDIAVSNCSEMEEKLSSRLENMKKVAIQAKQTVRMLEKENLRLEKVAELKEFNESISWLMPTSIAVAAFCLVTAFALSPAMS
eukprot:g453.t1